MRGDKAAAGSWTIIWASRRNGLAAIAGGALETIGV
ncbi:hypothetical protein J2847_002514 [Azospirillum agricola]|nr:hypothetical protein [Azospirillum agricola]